MLTTLVFELVTLLLVVIAELDANDGPLEDEPLQEIVVAILEVVAPTNGTIAAAALIAAVEDEDENEEESCLVKVVLLLFEIRTPSKFNTVTMFGPIIFEDKCDQSIIARPRKRSLVHIGDIVVNWCQKWLVCRKLIMSLVSIYSKI